MPMDRQEEDAQEAAIEAQIEQAEIKNEPSA